MEIRQESLKIERVLGILLLAFFIGYFVYKSTGVAEIAEKMKIQNRVRQIQTAIDLEFANLMMQNRQMEAQSWRGSNPFDFLKRNLMQPELDDVITDRFIEINQLSPGHWYFDVQKGVTFYRLINQDLVASTAPDAAILAWKIEPTQVEENDLIRKTKKIRIDGVYFKSLYDFNWNY